MHRHRQHVLLADHAAVEQGQARDRHQQDQRRRSQHPGGVAGVEGRGSGDDRRLFDDGRRLLGGGCGGQDQQRALPARPARGVSAGNALIWLSYNRSRSSWFLRSAQAPSRGCSVDAHSWSFETAVRFSNSVPASAVACQAVELPSVIPSTGMRRAGERISCIACRQPTAACYGMRVPSDWRTPAGAIGCGTRVSIWSSAGSTLAQSRRQGRKRAGQLARRAQRASVSVSPVRMRTAFSMSQTKILPSPIFSVRAAAEDGLDSALGQIVGDDDFDLHLRQELHGVFGTAVDLGLALLPAEPLDLGDGHSLYAKRGQGLADIVQFERLDNRGNHFHGPDLLDPSASNVSIPAHRTPKGAPAMSRALHRDGIRFDDRSKSRERFFTNRAIAGIARKCLQLRGLRPSLASRDRRRRTCHFCLIVGQMHRK